MCNWGAHLSIPGPHKAPRLEGVHRWGGKEWPVLMTSEKLGLRREDTKASPTIRAKKKIHFKAQFSQ